ncbi:MAG: hypothetical protein IPJ03_19015 [Ignavibacteriales bacterium]|nr:hypothetical protein [Ignavibacteriales bacterium]
MSETLIYIIIFAVIMFFMPRGHGAHGGGGMGNCSGHSHISHKGHSNKDNESDTNGSDLKQECEHQLHY